MKLTLFSLARLVYGQAAETMSPGAHDAKSLGQGRMPTIDHESGDANIHTLTGVDYRLANALPVGLTTSRTARAARPRAVWLSR